MPTSTPSACLTTSPSTAFALLVKEYTQSRKVTLRIIPRTGHAVAFNREHRTFANDMDH